MSGGSLGTSSAPHTRKADRAFAFGAWVLAASAIEVIIGMRFNLLQYPQIPLGITEITWARALLLIGLAVLCRSLWQLAGQDHRERTALGLSLAALAITLLDTLFHFDFAPVTESGGIAGHYASVQIGAFFVRVVPFTVLMLTVGVLALIRGGRPADHRDRWTHAAGLLMGVFGLLSVLPGIPYANIGIGDWNLRALLGDSYRVFRTNFRIGPASPTEIYYAGMFVLATFITVASMGRSDEDLKSKKSRNDRYLGYVDWAAMALVAFACFQYAYIGIERMRFTTFDSHTALIGCLAILYLCYRVFGAALAICGAVALAYFFVSSYLPGIFNAEYGGYTSLAENLWFNNAKAVLGQQLGILLNNVLPFIIFGALLSATGAAGSLIKISFYLMRNTRGGAAHAAVMASGLFGTVSGSAVSNVVGTGVITIPMIKKRGYSAEFAGGIEATASTGGQIMPPIMGAAALIMADLTGAGYLNIMVAAFIPAMAYYLSLFVNVVFESRRMNMQPQSLDDLEAVTRQDYINVGMLVLIPLAIVIWRLALGASPAGSAVTAICAVLALSAFSPTVREKPIRLLHAIAAGGITFGRLLMVVGVVGIIVGVMSTTDLPSKIGREIADFASIALVLTLIVTAIVSLLLGMGMPTLPAYLTVVIILGPSLNSLGLSPMTTHMFVFYFGVASAITPPVAVAAFAAAAIAGAKPMATGIAAVRIGVVIFAVPFIFALNPDLLIVPTAFVESSGRVFSLVGFVSALLRTALIIYLLATASGRFEKAPLSGWEISIRLVIAVLLISPTVAIHGPAFAVAAALIILHQSTHARREKAKT